LRLDTERTPISSVVVQNVVRVRSCSEFLRSKAI
jgi:hypothetical protein